MSLASEVPPTARTNGWLAGSSTERYGFTETVELKGVLAQSSDPVSPEAATKVWPCAAASSKIVFSSCCAPGEPVSSADSHSPQLVERIKEETKQSQEMEAQTESIVQNLLELKLTVAFTVAVSLVWIFAAQVYHGGKKGLKHNG